jgi:hypothetical protein
MAAGLRRFHVLKYAKIWKRYRQVTVFTQISGLRSSGMLYCVFGVVVPDVSIDHIIFFFRVSIFWTLKHRQYCPVETYQIVTSTTLHNISEELDAPQYRYDKPKRSLFFFFGNYFTILKYAVAVG